MANNVARPPSKLITTKKRGVVSKILMTSSRETAVKKEQNGQFVHFQKRTVIRAQKGRKRAPTSYFGDNFSSASSYTYRSAAPFFRFSNHLKNKNGTKYFLQSVLFTALLNRGAANNSCYPPADCQQREIILLSPALEFYHSAVEFYHPAYRKITIN